MFGRDGKYSFCLTDVLFEELIQMAETSRAHLLGERIALLLEMQPRILMPFWDLVRGELMMRTDRFLDAKEQKKGLSALRALARTGDPTALRPLAARLREFKASQDTTYKNMAVQAKALKEDLIKQHGGSPTFEQFWASYGRQGLAGISESMAENEADSIAQGQASRLVDSPDLFPTISTFIRIALARHYRALFGGKAVKDGDSYDDAHLTMVRFLDIFLSEDTGLREMADLVYGTSKSVISADSFLAQELSA